ncbi:hypothetical protein M758_9G130100 [Ceratodon purpureus]|nr:hypothetical protein M758_9G130100 [Ceratodon purpureus]
MAALQLRCWCSPTPAGDSKAAVARCRSISSVTTRRNALTLNGNSCRIGLSTRPLGLVPKIRLERRVFASLNTDGFGAFTDVAQRLVVPAVNTAPLLISRAYRNIQELPPVVQLSAAGVGLLVFASFLLAPSICLIWGLFNKKESNWEKSQTRLVLTSYVRPLVVWGGIIMMCRALDIVELPSVASIAVKQRFIHFVRSLATVSMFALWAGSLIQQVQKYLMKRSNLKDSRSVSLPFIGNAVSTSVWVAAVCLLLELLGFSTHKWLAAGGMGTVLLTLAGREILTNFLSSMMIHATKPFVESEKIQTKIEGQEVTGTVEHVGWWSATVIRGSEREAVLVPNHKFSTSVVRNHTQKTHWRIKTFIGINHHDVNKISKIVADMRKVIANHPEIEQKRLHRRVFFDHISSQNLALMIMVSCFVKTSRFEEYLRVKEVVLMDLLKVVAHHGGRLATPLRSVQRFVGESEARPVSYNGSQARPVVLNTGSTVDGEDESRVASNNPIFEQKPYLRNKSFKESTVTVETQTVTVATDTKDGSDPLSKWKARRSMSFKEVSTSVSSSSKSRLESVEAMALRARDGVSAGSSLEKPLVKAPDDEKEPGIRSFKSSS